MTRVHVLRIGYRLVRDDRITTHVGLVARAFGAEKIYLVDCDPKIKEAIDDVTKRWGGEFTVQEVEGWRALVESWKASGGLAVHLTMYGQNVEDVIEVIRGSNKDLLLVVSAKKAPRELFEMSNFNVAIGNQPHSEVSALGIFLDRYFRGEELKREFRYSRLKIIPSARGKKMVTLS